ncbi:sigma-54 dependent transcriptional regulator [Jiella sp. MQZ9-1]|uniref:DNA-binding transcriptional regulator NtrC n=1 Tax=Jiella flava TaxID=2816857 RepID=A0A939JSK8_9HYPH|nr:sigma-54 dependent transcriptional regulator [Jiella flava]MBO0663063.1 sigma-54-dependent Fis family transcriptional regulator [Jiella flava]MCD2471482.1 sigma-54 dependent transcriptional regulator [Jiella flava]
MTEIVLIVDDDPIQRRLIDAQVTRMGFTPLLCDGGQAALAALGGDAGGRIAAVVLDLMMPDTSGLAVMAEMRRRGLDVPIVVQTAKGSIDTVVAAMRAGAFDFVVKPVSPEKFRATLANAVRMRTVARPQRAGATLTAERASATMRPVLKTAAKAAASTIPILIEGETGVGKEWLAQAIRAASDRAAKPFVAVNCGALPSELVESILFGHAKGAFTSASETHSGKFVEADGGTLFLDEISDLAPTAQVKLLRVLQDGEIDPVGAKTAVRVDIRLISATNRKLSAAVAAGRFRADLYYRLNAVEIAIPPLRARRDEIRCLIDQILPRLTSLEKHARVTGIDRAAIALLEAYDWPGNIRQLENTLHRAVVLAEGPVLTVADFPQVCALIAAQAGAAEPPSLPVRDKDAEEVSMIGRPIDQALKNGELIIREAVTPGRPARGTDGGFPLRGEDGEIRRMVDIEADLIRMAFVQYDGRMTEIARRLGIGRSTLYRKMREYGIEERP